MPSARDNADVAAELVRGQSRATLEWRRDPAADEAARARAAALLADGVTLDDAVNVAFLIHPALQVELEQLAISRAELVRAATPPNPVLIAGSRKPGGNLAAFYPERAVSVGILQDVLALLNMPERVAAARKDLERARYDAAEQAVQHAAKVVQAWLEYCGALQIHQLNQDGAGDTLQSALTVATTRARLGQLMGTIGWRDDWQVTIPLPPAPAADPDLAEIEAQAMQQRLDLKAAEKAVDVRLRVLAMRRHFRWVGQLNVGVFRDQAIGGTPFTGPNVAVDVPLLDQRNRRGAAGRFRSAHCHAQARDGSSRSPCRDPGACGRASGNAPAAAAVR